MEEVDMECVLFRKLSRKAGGVSSSIARDYHSLGKLEKYVVMPKCREY